MSLTFVI